MTVVVELGVAVGVVACGGTSGREVKSPGVTAEDPGPSTTLLSPPPLPPDPVVGDTVAIGNDGGSVAVLAVEADVNAGRLFPAPRGKQYYAAQVEGCSGPKEFGLSFERSFFFLEMADKTVFDPALPVKKPDLSSGVLPAGGCRGGWVTFLIPDDAEPAAVAYDGSSRIKWRIPRT